MIIDRRVVIAALAMGGSIWARPAEACSIAFDRRDHFSDAACRRSLDRFVELLNSAATLSEARRKEMIDELSIEIDDQVLWDEIGEQARTLDRNYLFFANYMSGGGKPDAKPAKLIELNLLKSGRGHAIYQFTIRRHQYHPADPEGCNGLFVHDEFYGDEDRSYLGRFRNNLLQAMRAFDEWRFEA